MNFKVNTCRRYLNIHLETLRSGATGNVRLHAETMARRYAKAIDMFAQGMNEQKIYQYVQTGEE